MHLMVAVKALGNADDARILQIGGVAFDLGAGVDEPHVMLQADNRHFVAHVAAYGGTWLARTAEWWHHADQSAALESIGKTPAEPLDAALARFSKWSAIWLRDRGRALRERSRIWAKPPQFDLRILGHAFAAAGMELPWAAEQEHDTRTLVWAAGHVPPAGFRVPDLSNVGLVRHNALHDSVEQAIVLQASYRALVRAQRR